MIGIKDIFDILIVTLIFYYTFKFLRDRRAGRLALGVVLLLGLTLLSDVFEMNALNFILTNIFVIPCTTAILYFMMLALVLLPIKVISLFMLSAGAYVVKLMYEMVKWVAQLPGSSIDGIHINSVQLIAIYLVIISITYLFPYYIKVRDLRSLRKDT